MIVDNEIRTQYIIKRKLKFYFLLNSIRKNFENYDKKENNIKK